MDLGVAMIGCADEAGVEALAQRFIGNLRRVTHGRPVEVSVGHGSIALGGTASATAALEQAERAVTPAGRRHRQRELRMSVGLGARVRDRIVRRRTGGDPAVLGPGLLRDSSAT